MKTVLNEVPYSYDSKGGRTVAWWKLCPNRKRMAERGAPRIARYEPPKDRKGPFGGLDNFWWNFDAACAEEIPSEACFVDPDGEWQWFDEVELGFCDKHPGEPVPESWGIWHTDHPKPISPKLRHIDPGGVPGKLGKCRAPTQYAVLVEAYSLNPRVMDPKKMARSAQRYCVSYAYDSKGKYHPDWYEEHMSVAIMAAIAGKGMSAKQAIEDYNSGRYPGPDGCYVFGIAQQDVIPQGTYEDDDETEQPITAEVIGDWKVENQFIHDQIPSGTHTTDDEEMDPAELREMLATVLAVIIDMTLNQWAIEEPKKVEAFHAVYMSSCFPGATANGGISQREQADELGISFSTMRDWADEIRDRLAGQIGIPEDNPKVKLRHSVEGTGGKVCVGGNDPEGLLSGVIGEGGIAHICDLGARCPGPHNPVTITWKKV